ncbi:MAG: hypothetical protein IRZ16_19475 [Myxococcaceae bacterium]|nr:hypothetical protein [Myxococcaceae bacterium]
MPIDLAALVEQAHQAHQGLLKNEGYVRGGAFIGHFQQHALYELRRLNLPPAPITGLRTGALKFNLRENGVVLGAYFPKELDIFLEGNSSGPLLGISFKCMMSGIAKNVNNRWEELVGDASNLHSRFPMLCLGYVMILPARTRAEARGRMEEIIDGHGEPSPLARQIEGKLRGITGRAKPVELPTIYEEVALVVFDFDGERPKLHPNFPGPDLRIETFYDRLVGRFRERNHYLP